MKENITKYMRKSIFLGLLFTAMLPLVAQESNFDKFKQQQNSKFDQFKTDKQAEFDAFRKRVNEEYADFMRKAWESFPAHEAEKPKKEPEVKPIEFVEETPAPKPKPREEQRPPKEDIKPIDTPKPTIETKPVEIAVKPKVVVVPTPPPAPEPIAPVQPKEEPYKKVSIGYFGSIITIGFPQNDNLKLRALEENAIADAWEQLSESQYDITVSTALKARKSNSLCDWGYMKMLQSVCEKQYGMTNEAVLMQAFLMTQSGYRVRLGMANSKLYMLIASNYDIFDYSYYVLDGATPGERLIYYCVFRKIF